MTLTVFRSIDQVFCRMFLSWYLYDFFFMIRLGLQVWGRRTTEVRHHFHRITSGVHTVNKLIMVGVDLAYLAKEVLSGFSIRKLPYTFPAPLLFPLSIVYLREGSHCTQPTPV